MAWWRTPKRKARQGLLAPPVVKATYSSLVDLLEEELVTSYRVARTTVSTPRGKIVLYSVNRLLVGVASLDLYRAVRLRLAVPTVEDPLASYKRLQGERGGRVVKEVYQQASLAALLYLDALGQNNSLNTVREEVTAAVGERAKSWDFITGGSDKLLALLRQEKADEREAIYRLSLLAQDWLHTPLEVKSSPSISTEEEAYLLARLGKGPLLVEHLMGNPQGFLTSRLLKSLVKLLEEGFCSYRPITFPPSTPGALPSPSSLEGVGLPAFTGEAEVGEDEEEVAHALLPGVSLLSSENELAEGPAERFYPVEHLLPPVVPQEEQGLSLRKVLTQLQEVEEELSEGEPRVKQASEAYLTDLFLLHDRRFSYDLQELTDDDEGKPAPGEEERREELIAAPRQASEESFNRLRALEEARWKLLERRGELLQEALASAPTPAQEALLRRKLSGTYDIPMIAYDARPVTEEERSAHERPGEGA